MEQGTAQPLAAAAPGRCPLDIATIRATAQSVLMLGDTRPGLADRADAMRGNVEQLVPAVRALIARLPSGDAPARVARIGVDEAWRRLYTTRGFGPDAAHRHAQRLARSVLALCDHYENLTRPSTSEGSRS
ncbi:DUF6415 family natural product biosynthesis protein [Streptomyces sp. FIT100]|uniref:DUF6415 family natural product biosynthesis protein n=1 Tax=Streptomyces sp. FIT100 TaxID=2837956 RepID=UPI0021C5919A|nr:DUF6415 family natural product biosynthesis protein [Streptomyces sp. FIT100]UUN27042.1 hypothetical protein KK483_11985 [Streptomyces sp. FIT100]